MVLDTRVSNCAEVKDTSSPMVSIPSQTSRPLRQMLQSSSASSIDRPTSSSHRKVSPEIPDMAAAPQMIVVTIGQSKGILVKCKAGMLSREAVSCFLVYASFVLCDILYR